VLEEAKSSEASAPSAVPQLPNENPPRAFTADEIQDLIKAFVFAAQRAERIGIDGVELHGAHGYLLHQFLSPIANHRTDQYGGSIENRIRLLDEVIETVSTVFPSEQIGVRLSPYGTFNDIEDSDPIALFTAVINKLNGYKLAYVHMIEPRSTSSGGNDQVYEDAPITSELFRAIYQGKFITAGGYDQAMGEQVLEEGLADAVAYGRLYISNPDLVERFQKNAPLSPYNRATFYGGEELGYTDYPTL
jgi:N-ethylmaleimide reductase